MCGLFLRLVPYVGEVSPRPEAAAKTRASSQTAPEAREGKDETRAQAGHSCNAGRQKTRLGRPPKKTNDCRTYPQPLSGRAGGKSGKRALGLRHALNPKWHRKGLSNSSSRRESMEFRSGQVHASSIQHASSTRCVITCGDFHTESSGAFNPAHPPKRVHRFDESVKREQHKESTSRQVR